MRCAAVCTICCVAVGRPCTGPCCLLLQVNCEKITTGTVRRGLNCLCFSADGAWLFAGTASGDVLSVNVGRKAVQVIVLQQLVICW